MTREQRLAARDLVERFGGHPAAALGLDLARDADVGRWFVAALLLAGRGPEARATTAWRALDEAGCAAPEALASADPGALNARLEGASQPDAEATAQRLRRACAALCERHAGSFASLAARSDDLAELGGHIARLAPGVGTAAVLRFLRPLREVWSAASEVPLDPAARAAAVHLGLLAEGEDEEGFPGVLRAALAEQTCAPALADLEAALARIGRQACLRGRPERCPLGPTCPLRAG